MISILPGVRGGQSRRKDVGHGDRVVRDASADVRVDLADVESVVTDLAAELIPASA